MTAQTHNPSHHEDWHNDCQHCLHAAVKLCRMFGWKHNFKR